MAVTQKKIAEALGVSPQLVGLALNGHPRVSEKTRARILETARRMGYDQHANRDARLMAARRHGGHVKSGMIAMLLPASFEGEPLAGVPFFAPLLQGAQMEAGEREVDILLCSSRRGRLPRLVSERGVDGVICVQMASLVPATRQLGLPVVLLPCAHPEAYSLLPDERQGIRRAVEYLVSLGHRRIAYLGFTPTFASAAERAAGYREERAALAIPEGLEEATLTVPPMVRGGAEGMERLLGRARLEDGRPGFTAVVCYNDLVAMGAIQKLEERGLRVPQDVSVVGFDDVALAYGFRPALTSVSFPRLEMGRRAVRLLCEDLHRDAQATTREVFPVDLAVRDTTAQPRDGT